LILGLWRPNYFLFLVGLFSFYLAFAGYRVLYRKRPDLGQRATALDYVVTVICLAASFGAAGDVCGEAGFRSERCGPCVERFRADWNGGNDSGFAGFPHEV